MFIIGFMLISTTQLLPQFSQELMGYDAITAGETLSLGGVLTIVLMPVSGLVSGKVQPKYLLFGALAMTAFSLYHLTGLDPEVSFWTLAEDRMLQVVALPFLFIPITVGIVCRHSAGQNQRGVGDHQFDAQPGRQRRRVVHHDVAAAARSVPSRTARRAVSRGSPICMASSLAQMGRMVDTQASVLSYIDVFYVLAVIAVVVTPMVLFLRNVPKGARAGGH